MKRDCFFCDIEVEGFTTQLWELPGIGRAEIGFGICTGCGMVLQTPSATPEDVVRYYNETAVYNNPGRNGQPGSNKIKGVANQLRLIRDTCGSVADSVLQVGCSDGYTLAKMREAGATRVTGLDPGTASNKLAESLHGVRTIVSTFESYESSAKYDLIVMTHILEHLFDPLKAVRKAAAMQEDGGQEGGGWLLLEVPLLEQVEALPPGYFTFEHLNYFSESTVLRLLHEAGYTVHAVEKIFGFYDYPAIAVVARKELADTREGAGDYSSDYVGAYSSDYNRARVIVSDYLARDSAAFNVVEQRIKQSVAPAAEVYIWGAGVHTAQLFANTDIKDYLKIKGLLDSSEARWGKKVGGFTCFEPAYIDLGAGDTIVISSFASESEIYDALRPLRERGVKVVRLYAKEEGLADDS